MTTDTPIFPRKPATADDLAQTVAAVDPALRIRMVGSASMLPDAAHPSQTISTARLNKILEHAVADMTVIVQAGVSLEQLQRHLAWQNQWLPIDPPALAGRPPGQRTLGGIVATNSLGPLRLGFGDFRSHVLGMRWVDASGTLIKAGGRTVKNVAGYATHRMLIGSMGRLGAIAEIALRTHPRPADEQSALFYCPTPAAAEALLAEIDLVELDPGFTQVIGGRGFAGNTLDLPQPPAGFLIVAVGFFGRAEVCAAQVQRVRALPAAASIESIAALAAPSGRLRLWMTSEPPGDLAFRLFTLPGLVASTLAAIESLSPDTFLVAEAAHGVIRGSLRATAPAGIPTLQQQLATLAAATNAACHILPGPGPAPSDLETRIQRQLDPAGRFLSA